MCLCACVCEIDEGECIVDPLDRMRSLKTFYGMDDGGRGLGS